MFGDNRHTAVDIDGTKFTINGHPTLEGRSYKNHSIEGLLFGSRMAQAIFDDENSNTKTIFAYPDSGKWNPERNVREFLWAMAQWRAHGLQYVSVSFQGGKPVRRPPAHPWVVSGFNPDGTLKEAWLDRLERVLERADILGMVVILGYFYSGQDDILEDEESVRRGAQNLTEWVIENEFTNVLLEVSYVPDYEQYSHRILQPDRIGEVISLVKEMTSDVPGYPVGCSISKDVDYTNSLIKQSDFLMLKGKYIQDTALVGPSLDEIRQKSSFEDKPIIYNEDPLVNFDPERKPGYDWPNSLYASIAHNASWGYHDPGINNYQDGFQCPPVDWRINTKRKQVFFDYLQEIVNPTER